MIIFRITYFNQHGFQHSTEDINIPVASLVGATQDDICKILDSSRKYNSMDCVYTCVKGHSAVLSLVPTLRRLKKEEKISTIFD